MSNAPEIKVEDNKDKSEKEETDEAENEIPTTPRPSKFDAKNESRRESVNDKTDLETEPESEVSSEKNDDDVDQPVRFKKMKSYLNFLEKRGRSRQF